MDRTNSAREPREASGTKYQSPQNAVNRDAVRPGLNISEPEWSILRLPRIERRRSRVHGWGVFALQPITKNTRIIPYTGEKVTHRESLKREKRYLRQGKIWCFRLNNRWVVDAAVGGSDARFINHACRPNCYAYIADGVIWIRAARNIEAGEELTYNYNTEGAGSIPCRCQPGCRTML
jgi:hypothetical protein